LRYIQGTTQLGLLIQPSKHLSLNAYCDTYWAGCPDDRRSTTDFIIFYGPNLIFWSYKKQHSVSRSTTEAEYRSLAVTTEEVLWLKALLHELGQLPSLWCDNLGATFLPSFNARTKHIELDVHFIREKLTLKQISVFFFCSID
jgi:hypothetical protein